MPPAYHLAFLGADLPASASLASRIARRRAVFARTAVLFASRSRIACVASRARRSFIAAAELGCSVALEAIGIGPSPRSWKAIQEIPVSGPLRRHSCSTKKPATEFQSRGSGHKLCQYIRGQSDMTIPWLAVRPPAGFQLQTCRFCHRRRRRRRPFGPLSECPCRHVPPR